MRGLRVVRVSSWSSVGRRISETTNSHETTRTKQDTKPERYALSVKPRPPTTVNTGGQTFSRYKISRLSPTRRVTRVRSKYSSSGIAYFRDTPAISLNLA